MNKPFITLMGPQSGARILHVTNSKPMFTPPPDMRCSDGSTLEVMEERIIEFLNRQTPVLNACHWKLAGQSDAKKAAAAPDFLNAAKKAHAFAAEIRPFLKHDHNPTPNCWYDRIVFPLEEVYVKGAAYANMFGDAKRKRAGLRLLFRDVRETCFEPDGQVDRWCLNQTLEDWFKAYFCKPMAASYLGYADLMTRFFDRFSAHPNIVAEAKKFLEEFIRNSLKRKPLLNCSERTTAFGQLRKLVA